ncbi:unnamed protein product [Musa acuminata subsp. malaccensis]|uniref:(wild Malaysian banana) hypothetical protein n=1 Tax=Musa acuminata subsp. malaccensis TaxID=214687 RepID=A0A804HQS3_MUSAM|nr:unnamed protein product [Musa acuminata subsp. malaccensis]
MTCVFIKVEVFMFKRETWIEVMKINYLFKEISFSSDYYGSNHRKNISMCRDKATRFQVADFLGRCYWCREEAARGRHLHVQRGDGILQRGEPSPADRQRRVPGDIELSMLRRRSNPRFLGMMIVVSEHCNLQLLSSGKIFLLTQESHQMHADFVFELLPGRSGSTYRNSLVICSSDIIHFDPP